MGKTNLCCEKSGCDQAGLRGSDWKEIQGRSWGLINCFLARVLVTRCVHMWKVTALRDFNIYTFLYVYYSLIWFFKCAAGALERPVRLWIVLLVLTFHFNVDLSRGTLKCPGCSVEGRKEGWSGSLLSRWLGSAGGSLGRRWRNSPKGNTHEQVNNQTAISESVLREDVLTGQHWVQGDGDGWHLEWPAASLDRSKEGLGRVVLRRQMLKVGLRQFCSLLTLAFLSLLLMMALETMATLWKQALFLLILCFYPLQPNGIEYLLVGFAFYVASYVQIPLFSLCFNFLIKGGWE